MNRLKKIVREAWEYSLASLSSSNNAIYLFGIRYFFNPKPGSFGAFLDQFSKSTENFQLVQIGANDGITHDPVHKFIKRNRWAGVLLEPQSWLVKNKLRPLYRKHDNIIIENLALGKENGAMDLYSIAFSKMRWATGLARVDRNSLLDLFKNGTISRRAAKHGIEVPDSPEDWIDCTTVKTTNAQSLIDRNNLKKIDLLMIDAEGYDAEVVRLFLKAKPKPLAIAFEEFHLEDHDKALLLNELTDAGYVHKTIGPNTIAAKEQIQAML